MLPTLAMRRRMAGKPTNVHPLQDTYLQVSIRTKGGAGGPTTVVTSLSQLVAVANATGPQIIVVQGAISGAAKVQVGSDKTIVGKSGSCAYSSCAS